MNARSTIICRCFSRSSILKAKLYRSLLLAFPVLCMLGSLSAPLQGQGLWESLWGTSDTPAKREPGKPAERAQPAPAEKPAAPAASGTGAAAGTAVAAASGSTGAIPEGTRQLAPAGRAEPLPPDLRSTGAGLFVGINEFDESESLRLRFAVNDAIAQAHLFALELGLIAPQRTFVLTSGEPLGAGLQAKKDALRDAGVYFYEATRSNILRFTLSLRQGLDPNGFLVVSFSTHGFERDGVNYALPKDGFRDLLKDTGVNLNTIQQVLQDSEASKKLLLVDACRETVDGKGAEHSMTEGFKQAFAAAKGFAALLSCGPGQLSHEPEELGHGLFTYHLLQALRGGIGADASGFIRLGQVSDAVARAVPQWWQSRFPGTPPASLQTPWFTGGGDAREIPLALHRDQRDQRLLDLVSRARDADRSLISGTMEDAILKALRESSGERRRILIENIELLSTNTPAARRLFVNWWKGQGAGGGEQRAGDREQGAGGGVLGAAGGNQQSPIQNLPSEVRSPGGLIVKTVPLGAQVRLGGLAEQPSPAMFTEVPAGRHKLSIVLEGYETHEQMVVIPSGDFAEIKDLALKRETGTLLLASRPGNLRWTLLERPAGAEGLPAEGRTPGVLREVPTGHYAVRFENPGWPELTESGSVQANQNTTLEAAFVAGTLIADSTPRGATVTLLGSSERVLGTTPLTVSDLQPGLLRFRLSKPGYADNLQQGTLAPGGRLNLSATLEEQRGPQPDRDVSIDLGDGQSLEMVWVAVLKGWVGQYEVTNGQFRRFRPAHDSGSIIRYSLNGDRQPVVEVNYDDAVAFATWLTKQAQRAGTLPEGFRFRLPDGDEWTRLAQCGDSRTYPWGNEWPPKYGNYHGQEQSGPRVSAERTRDIFAVTAPVEQSGRNEWNLYGVGGNVWEWTSESRGSSRVLRGASWDYNSQRILRVDNRLEFHSSSRNNDFGFRVVLFR